MHPDIHPGVKPYQVFEDLTQLHLPSLFVSHYPAAGSFSNMPTDASNGTRSPPRHQPEEPRLTSVMRTSDWMFCAREPSFPNGSYAHEGSSMRFVRAVEHKVHVWSGAWSIGTYGMRTRDAPTRHAADSGCE